MEENIFHQEATEHIKTIESAELADIEGIIKVQNDAFVDRERLVEDPTLSEKGFLLYKTSKEDLEKIINNPENHIFLVAKENGNVVGYLLGYSLNEWIDNKPSWKNGLDLNQDIPEDFLNKNIIYIRQIAVLPEKEGIGFRLEKKFLSESRNRGYGLAMGDILHEPIENKKSMEFHQRMGFKKIGQVDDGDLTWSLLSLDLKRENH